MARQLCGYARRAWGREGWERKEGRMDGRMDGRGGWDGVD